MANNQAALAAVQEFLSGWDREAWMFEHAEWDDDNDRWRPGLVDPDEVSADTANQEPLGGTHVRGWDCVAGWAAFRVGQKLILNWYRTECVGARIPRDLWVVVDPEYFVELEEGQTP